MDDLNEIRLRGRLTRDVTISKNGPSSLGTLNMVTNYAYKTKDGEKRETATYHRVVLWGNAADNAAKYLSKGQQVEVDGRLSTRSYEKDGKTQYITEVVGLVVRYGRKPQNRESAPAPDVETTEIRSIEGIDPF
jgi:single-strand DNA-binding protein